MKGLDSTTTINRLAMLRLGNTTTTDDDDSDDTVIFSDPCSCCGAMKRLRSSPSSPLQESPRNKKKIFLESPSNIHHSDHLQPTTTTTTTTNPFLRSIPNSPSLQSFPFVRTSSFNSVSVPFTSSENKEINSVSCFNSKKSSSVPFIRRCNSVPLTTSENINFLPSTTTSPPPVSFSNPPNSPENFTPPSKRAAYHLDRMCNSFSSSCGTQKSAVEESPVKTTSSLPPRPSLHRSFSDVNPCVTPVSSTLNSDDDMTTSTASGQSGQIHSPVMSNGDNPSSRRWKRIRKSLMEMNKWLNYTIQEQSKEEEEEEEEDVAADDEGEEKKIDNEQVQQIHETVVAEENVSAERDGDAMKVRCVCSCGKHYQVAMSI